MNKQEKFFNDIKENQKEVPDMEHKEYIESNKNPGVLGEHSIFDDSDKGPDVKDAPKGLKAYTVTAKANSGSGQSVNWNWEQIHQIICDSMFPWPDVSSFPSESSIMKSDISTEKKRNQIMSRRAEQHKANTLVAPNPKAKSDMSWALGESIGFQYIGNGASLDFYGIGDHVPEFVDTWVFKGIDDQHLRMSEVITLEAIVQNPDGSQEWHKVGWMYPPSDCPDAKKFLNRIFASYSAKSNDSAGDGQTAEMKAMSMPEITQEEINYLARKQEGILSIEEREAEDRKQARREEARRKREEETAELTLESDKKRLKDLQRKIELVESKTKRKDEEEVLDEYIEVERIEDLI